MEERCLGHAGAAIGDGGRRVTDMPVGCELGFGFGQMVGRMGCRQTLPARREVLDDHHSCCAVYASQQRHDPSACSAASASVPAGRSILLRGQGMGMADAAVLNRSVDRQRKLYRRSYRWPIV
jgi:hypothetical protein